jgi:endonuclease/exonuclease/phosphatase family metal-dependent hydrolase
MNIGTDRRGAAILAKDGLVLSNIQRLPLGRGMSASFRGILIVNIYAPSGAEKRQQRDAFYNTEVVHLIPSSSTAMILAGDFNCVITKDCTGQRNCSRALARLIRRLDFIDVWEATPTRTAYAHYTATGTSRIYRIYVTHYLRRRQQGVETVAAAFTDHFAVILRLTVDVPCSLRAKGYWQMNVSFLSDHPSYKQRRRTGKNGGHT